MILSASRRTDIPAFYSEWLARRVEAGYCLVPNPFNARQVARVSLLPEDVEAIVFWTRHARPALPLVARLLERGTSFYFHYTITGYGRPLELRTPPLEVATRAFRELSDRLPSGAVIWRYDPIILGPAFPVAAHRERFARIAKALEGYTRRVVVSALEPYKKTARRMAPLVPFGSHVDRTPQLDDVLARLVAIAGEHGMTVEACAQARDYSEIGVHATRCIDPRLLAELFGGSWPTRKDPGQRPACGCIASKDIGMVDSCAFGCAYCYATRSDAAAWKRRKTHDPSGASLLPLDPALNAGG